MIRSWMSVLLGPVAAVGLPVGVAGCHTDKPHEYGQQRPDIYDVDARDRDLQSMDINQAADVMAADLLSDRKLNESRTQWVLVVKNIEDRTRGSIALTDMDLFLQALKDRLARQGDGRVQLVTERRTVERLRAEEGRGGYREPYGQGGGEWTGGGGGALSPDYALHGVARNLPRRGTNYYQIEFDVTDLRDGRQMWTRVYPVKVAR